MTVTLALSPPLASDAMAPLQTLLIFVGIPTLAIAAICTVAIVGTRRRTGGDGTPPAPAPAPARALTGAVAAAHRCWVTAEPGGGERHHDDKPRAVASTRRRLTRGCWSVRCAGCEAPYRENGELVHFQSQAHAVAVTAAHGWAVREDWILCGECSRVSDQLDADNADQTAP